jgi:hypothetical protein
MQQNRAPSPSCASPISGEPTIHFRIGIGVHSIEKQIKFRRTNYPNTICNFSGSIPLSAIESSSSQVSTRSHKQRAITTKVTTLCRRGLKFQTCSQLVEEDTKWTKQTIHKTLTWLPIDLFSSLGVIQLLTKSCSQHMQTTKSTRKDRNRIKQKDGR